MIETKKASHAFKWGCFVVGLIMSVVMAVAFGAACYLTGWAFTAAVMTGIWNFEAAFGCLLAIGGFGVSLWFMVLATLEAWDCAHHPLIILDPANGALLDEIRDEFYVHETISRDAQVKIPEDIDYDLYNEENKS